MTTLCRIALSTAPYRASIVLAWHRVTDGIAQGAPYLLAGWWASLIGLFVVTMALIGPLLGALVSLLLAVVLRLRRPAAVGVETDRWLSFAAPAAYFGASWVTWQLMWWARTLVPTEHAAYGSSYFWILALLGATVAVPVGAFAAHLVIRQLRVGADA